MNNAKQLRAELCEVFQALKDGSIRPLEASELANLAGKMIASAKVQVEYYALRKESPTIDFLQDDQSPLTYEDGRAEGMKEAMRLVESTKQKLTKS